MGHAPATNTLEIVFRKRDGSAGVRKCFANFTASDFAAFLAADSLGAYYREVLRPQDEHWPPTTLDGHGDN